MITKSTFPDANKGCPEILTVIIPAFAYLVMSTFLFLNSVRLTNWPQYRIFLLLKYYKYYLTYKNDGRHVKLV